MKVRELFVMSVINDESNITIFDMSNAGGNWHTSEKWFNDNILDFVDREVESFYWDKNNIVKIYLSKEKGPRTCSICGKEMWEGWYDEETGDYICCEEEFKKYMDDLFGAGNWRPTEDEDASKLFEYLDPETGEWEDYDIYYTEWED